MEWPKKNGEKGFEVRKKMENEEIEPLECAPQTLVPTKFATPSNNL